MIVGKYIKQLLDERKRVILPGFGNLEVKDKGKTPTSGNRIDPPGLLILFDAGYSKDDGLLASVLAAGEKMDEEEAGQRVLELVDAIKFALDKGESYAIPETGTLNRDDDGKVHFKVDPNWVLEPDQYGLESVDLLELEELPEEEEKVPEKEKIEETPSKVKSETKPEAPPPERPILRTSNLTTLHEPEKKKPRHTNRWRIIWIVTGALILILAGLIFIPSGNDRKPKQKEPAITGTEKTDVRTEPQETIGDQTPEEQLTPEEQITESAEAEETPAVEEPPPEVQEHNYFIIAGSFKHLKYASDLQDQLKAKGYAAEVMVTENRMYRVSVSSYATKEEAEEDLAGVKAESGLESCWLLSN